MPGGCLPCGQAPGMVLFGLMSGVPGAAMWAGSSSGVLCLVRLLQLYRQHISPDVQKEDLFPGGGDYQPRNKWNQDTSSGAMHLIQVRHVAKSPVKTYLP